ncbi:MAG: hypothetical protein AABZ60_01265 [Planctomycetota bacterium]
MDETFSMESPGQTSPKTGGSPILRVLGIGCLVFFLIGIGIVAYISMTWRSWTVHFVNLTMNETLKTASLSEEEQKTIRQAVGKVTAQFESGEMTAEDFQRLVEKFVQGPLFMKINFQEFTNQYILKSGFSLEEKIQASLHLNRILRGWAEKKISQDKVTHFLILFPPNFKEEAKQKKLTEEEIRNIIRQAEDLADQFFIPKEEFQLDIAKALEEMVEEYLKK